MKTRIYAAPAAKGLNNWVVEGVIYQSSQAEPSSTKYNRML